MSITAKVIDMDALRHAALGATRDATVTRQWLQDVYDVLSGTTPFTTPAGAPSAELRHTRILAVVDDVLDIGAAA